MDGSGEQDYNHHHSCNKKKHKIDLKIRENSGLVVGSGEQD